MPDPDILRIVPLTLFPIFFLIGIMGKPVYFPIAYMTLWLTKLSNYYPFITQLKIELLIASLGLIIIFFKTGKKSIDYLSIKDNLVHRYFMVLLGCMLLSLIVSWDIQFSWDVKIYDFTKVIILYLMIILSIDTERDFTLFIWFFVLLYCYLSYEPVFGFINNVGGSKEMYGETYISDSGLLSGHVALANNMNQMIPFAFFLLKGTKNRFLKALAGFTLVMLLVCLVGSKSRGGVAGFLMLGLFIVYYSKDRIKNGFFVLFIVGLMFYISGDMMDTMSRIDSTSTHGRFAGLTNGIEMVLKGNILGVGPGCYLIARKHYFSYYMESHNIYGQVLGDLGLPGTIAVIFFVRQIYIYLIKSRRQVILATNKLNSLHFIITAIIVSLTTRLFISMGSHGLYFYYYYVVAALSVALARITRIDMHNRSFN